MHGLRKLFAVLFIGAYAVAFNPYQDVSERLKGAHEVGLGDVVFVIRSQAPSPHVERARRIRDDIAQQCRLHNLGHPDVVLLHERYGGPHSGHWTLFPALPKLFNEFEEKKWFFFCEEDTRVNVQGLIALLSRFSSGEEWFLGKSLFDQEATIIHHFRFNDMLSEFIFPDFDAGWILSESLLKSMVSRLKEENAKIDFSIDVKHELAHYIWNEESGLHMTGLPQLCAGNIDPSDLSPLTDEQVKQKIQSSKENPSKSGSICVTASPKALPECGPPVPGKNIFFAVKTCEKFHKERVPVVQRTWGRFAKHMVYFSDKADLSIPTVATGIPNTERGHCGKTFAIFDQFLNNPEYRAFPWLAVTDDDTIISVSRLHRLLSCYDATKRIMLGERYGYGQVKGYGYDYITGGGGMIFSRPAVDDLISNGCRCSKNEDPDDMIIGMCAKRYGIPLAHSPLFHQARPSDYAKGLLAHQTPVSFHKHWNVNPDQVYSDWFLKDDEAMQSASHDEL
nr:beta-1,3-glucosyltransferase-like [Lytechinus pictus]